MKTKMYVLVALLMASMTNLRADDEEISLYSGTHSIGYKGNQGFFIGRTSFSNNSAVAGNLVRIEGTLTATDHKCWVGEWADENDVATVHLPGSEYKNVPKVNDGEDYSFTYDIFLTDDMLNKIVTEGKDFRIYGEGMTITSAKLVQPGKAGALKFGKTIWTGYFWMDDKWSLEIFKEAFASIDFSKYGKMRIYYEANRTDFLMRLFTKFGDNPDEEVDGDDLKIAGSYTDVYQDGEARTINGVKVPMELITLHNYYVDIPLTEAIKTNLGTINETYGRSLFIQCNLNKVDPFNVTDVVLLPISPDDCSNCFYVY